MKPDVIISWPRNCDYPLWRQFIRDNRNRFEKVIIVFTETNNGANYRHFVTRAMQQDDVTILESPVVGGREDWRNIAINYALQFSNSDWVWFTEQDFFPLADFWQYIEEGEKLGGVICVKEGYRIHPCCLFIRRDQLEKTSKNFGIVADKLDHFGLVQIDIESLSIPRFVLPQTAYVHMSGLSHNMRLVAEGQRPNWNKQEFDEYIKNCLAVTVELSDYFVSLYTNYMQPII